MAKLFEIVDEFKRFYEIMTDEDADEETVKTTLECLKADLANKAAGYVKVMTRLEMEYKKADENEKAWKAEKNVRKNNLKRIKDTMAAAMVELGMDMIDTGNSKIKLLNNGGQLPLEIVGDVPEQYCKITIEPDNEKIRKALEEGKELKFAHFGERGQHITYK